MKKVVTWTAMLLFAGFLGIGLRGCTLLYPATTMTSLSPDDKLRVTLHERRLDIDRNFELRLEEIETGRTRTVFRSPDEGRPIGSERVVWSMDGSRFLLLGRHFYISDSGKLTSGEQAYLMMDVRSGRIWCNAEQQSKFPNFGSNDLTAITWLGWTPEWRSTGPAGRQEITPIVRSGNTSASAQKARRADTIAARCAAPSVAPATVYFDVRRPRPVTVRATTYRSSGAMLASQRR